MMNCLLLPFALLVMGVDGLILSVTGARAKIDPCVGEWRGKGDYVARYRTSDADHQWDSIMIVARADGTAAGSLGEYLVADAKVFRNRTWLGKTAGIMSDFNIRGTFVVPHGSPMPFSIALCAVAADSLKGSVYAQTGTSTRLHPLYRRLSLARFRTSMP